MNTQRQKLNFNHAQYDMANLCVELATSEENQPITDLIPFFSNGINSVKLKLITINGLLAPAKEITTGTAQQKRELKYNLAEKIFAISDPFAGWASTRGDLEKYHAYAKPVSAYKRMRPSNIISQADNIISTITPILQELAGTGISQEALNLLIEAREAFAPYGVMPRSKVVSKHDKSVQIVTLLNQVMYIFRTQLDKFAAGFLTLDQKSFYNQWLRSRKLTPYGTHTTRASVNVYIGDADAPATNAAVAIEGTSLKGYTNENGHTTISRIPFKKPLYFIVTVDGFPNPVKEGPYTCKKGKAVHITVNMNEFNIPEPVKESSDATPGDILLKQFQH